jgi:hypothetical protein
MSLEERIQKSVEAALADMRARVEEDVRSMVQQVVSAAEQERAEAVDVALREAADKANRDSQQRVSEAEERARAGVDQLVEAARADERELAQDDAWRLAEAKAEQQIQDALRSAREEMTQALAEAESRAEQVMRDSVTAARVGERESELAAISRLLESVRGLDGASTLSEVLDALALAAAREASRAAVLVLRSDRLLGWKLSGFGARDSQPKLIDLAVSEAGVLGLAVSSARSATTRDGQAAGEGPDFADLPSDRMGLAVPVIVGGRVVAVVYADGVTPDGRDPLVPSSWPEVIEILARHAARCLESLTVQKSTSAAPSPRFWVPPGNKGVPPPSDAPASPPTQDQPKGPTSGAMMSRAPDNNAARGPEEAARRFARLLLSDIRLNHEPAVDEGRRGRNLLSRLGPEIERARRLYEAQVPASLRTRAELFHQELVATLAGGNPALLGGQA